MWVSFLFRIGALASFLLYSFVLGEPIRLATYNLRNYLIMDRPVDGTWRKSYPKPESEKAIVRAVIRDANPDVLILQEMGTLPFLKELQADLAEEGVKYPYLAHMQGDDSVRHLAVLSKVEPIDIVHHRDLEIRYQGKREFVKRGMLELSFSQSDEDRFKVFVVHLKSRWTTVKADPKSLQRRTLEAEACRNRVIERTFDLGVTDFMIAGDFNDHPRSLPMQRFYKRGSLGIGSLVPAFDSKGERWTHYYAKEVVYSSVDGFVTSTALLSKIDNQCGSIVNIPNTIEGSDHRMVYIDLIQP